MVLVCDESFSQIKKKAKEERQLLYHKKQTLSCGIVLQMFTYVENNDI